jgi:antirestriction protein ArdC
MQKEKFDVYQKITDIIIEKLENGVVPWQQPFGLQGMPKNYVSKKEYRGINAFLLNMTRMTNHFMTYKQAKELGGNVKKGSKGLPVIYYNFIEREGEEVDEIKKIPFLKYYTVFSIDDIEGIDFKIENRIYNENSMIENCESVVENIQDKPQIIEKYGRAAYSKSLDAILMPRMNDFLSSEHYYAIMFHELGHSTGHPNRLNRTELVMPKKFGDSNYAKEELTAEMCSAYLCGFCGIENKVIDNSANYIADWLEVLKNDKKFVFDAATKAQKAADYILNRVSNY